jgi:hypothetical protein
MKTKAYPFGGIYGCSIIAEKESERELLVQIAYSLNIEKESFENKNDFRLFRDFLYKRIDENEKFNFFDGEELLLILEE